MQFGYTIIYVADVEATLNFYVSAFGFDIRFLDESKLYGELDTGYTILGFSAQELAEKHGLETAANTSDAKAPGFEVAFVTDDVSGTYQNAVAAGAVGLKEPELRPWGQTIAYVRDLNGILVELCSPIV